MFPLHLGFINCRGAHVRVWIIRLSCMRIKFHRAYIGYMHQCERMAIHRYRDNLWRMLSSCECACSRRGTCASAKEWRYGACCHNNFRVTKHKQYYTMKCMMQGYFSVSVFSRGAEKQTQPHRDNEPVHLYWKIQEVYVCVNTGVSRKNNLHHDNMKHKRT